MDTQRVEGNTPSERTAPQGPSPAEIPLQTTTTSQSELESGIQGASSLEKTGLEEIKGPSIHSVAETKQNSRFPEALEEALPAETVAILAETPQENYRVRAFVKEIDGTPRTVVLLGEYHIKDKEAHRQGHRVISCFQYRGTENVKPSRYWVGKIAIGVFNRIENFARNTLKIKAAEYGSSISTAYYEDELQSLTTIIAENLSTVIIENNLSPDNRQGWEKITVKNREREIPLTTFVAATFKHKDLEVSGEEILQKAFSMAENRKGNKEHQSEAATIFDLEASHQPTLSEQLTLIYPLAVIAGFGGYITSSFVFGHSLPPIVTLAIVGTSATLAASRGLAKFFEKRIGDSSLYELLKFGPVLGLIKARNKTFAKTIDEIFVDNSEIGSLLAITGRGHTPGMSRFLKRDHGWQELDVPGQKKGY